MDKHFKKLFADARNTLQSIEKANKNIVVKDPYQTKVEKTKEWRHRFREVLLNRLVPERKCPICNKLKLKSRQWVIVPSSKRKKTEGHRIVCRGCYRRLVVND